MPTEPLLTDRQDILPPGPAINKPGVTLTGGTADRITVHETDNTDAGANAQMHNVFVHNGGGDRHVSFHATVDDHESIQMLSWYEAAWHAADGGGPGNYDSIAIETCVNSDGNWEQTKRNLVKLIKALMGQFNIPATKVVQHNYWSGKNCPRKLRANGGKEWAEIMAAIGAQSDVNNRYFPETGQYISNAFKAQWETLEKIKNATGTSNVAMDLVGYPITPELREVLGDGQEYTVQYFQRARFEWHPERNPGLVMLGLVGAELQACKQDADHDCACEEPKA